MIWVVIALVLVVVVLSAALYFQVKGSRDQAGEQETLLRDRLIRRRMNTGVPEAEAIRFVDFSDMPNVRLCQNCSMPADYQLEIDSNGDYRCPAVEADRSYEREREAVESFSG